MEVLEGKVYWSTALPSDPTCVLLYLMALLCVLLEILVSSISGRKGPWQLTMTSIRHDVF